MTERSRAWLSMHEPDPELVWMVVASLAVHVAAATILFLLPKSFFASTPPPVVAYTVKIVDPNSLGGRLLKGPLRPEKEPAGTRDAAPEEAKPETKPPEPEPAPEPKPEAKPEPAPEQNVVKIPDKKPEVKPAKKPEPKKPEPKTQAKPEKKVAAPKPSPAAKKPSAEELARQERDRQIQDAVRRMGEKGRGKEAAGLGGTEEGKGAALGIGGDGGGGGILTGLDFIIYKNQVEGIIKRNWTWVGANPNLTVRVGFRIQSDGEITDLRIVERSSDSSYDESVVRAIRISSPLPPPPDKYRDVFGNYLLDFVSGQLQSG